jgi:hypothetical protein
MTEQAKEQKLLLPGFHGKLDCRPVAGGMTNSGVLVRRMIGWPDSPIAIPSMCGFWQIPSEQVKPLQAKLNLDCGAGRD